MFEVSTSSTCFQSHSISVGQKLIFSRLENDWQLSKSASKRMTYENFVVKEFFFIFTTSKHPMTNKSVNHTKRTKILLLLHWHQQHFWRQRRDAELRTRKISSENSKALQPYKNLKFTPSFNSFMWKMTNENSWAWSQTVKLSVTDSCTIQCILDMNSFVMFGMQLIWFCCVSGLEYATSRPQHFSEFIYTPVTCHRQWNFLSLSFRFWC